MEAQERILRFVTHANWILFSAASLIGLITFPLKFSLGIICGGLIVTVNFHLLYRTLKKAFKPEGFNIGINEGKIAGAGIDKHMHVHIVPRWGGDTNFMPMLAEVRVLPEHLDKTYEKLYPIFQELKL